MPDIPDRPAVRSPVSDDEARRIEKDKADKHWTQWLTQFIQTSPPAKPPE